MNIVLPFALADGEDLFVEVGEIKREIEGEIEREIKGEIEGEIINAKP